MMKNAIVSFVLVLGTSNAFAISNEKLAEVCLQKGIDKVVAQADLWGCEVSADQIEVAGIDNRWYNPSKYVWYQVTTPCNGQDRVVKLVQYQNGQCR